MSRRDRPTLGRAVVGGQLHPYVEPIFTPPWNRCTEQTAAALANLGFQVLSRDHTAVPFGRAEPRRARRGTADGRLVRQDQG